MIRPLPGYCLIEPIEEEEKSAGGVFLTEGSKDKPSKGKIIASSGIFSFEGNIMPLEDDMTFHEGYKKIKAGTIVVYKKWTNQEVTHEGKEYLLVKFDELLAVIE